jgi:hypothetical protein
MWKSSYGKIIKKAHSEYLKNWTHRIDFHRFKCFVKPNIWKIFIKYSNNLTPKSAIKCAIEGLVFPICKNKFVGFSNGINRAVCYDCRKHPSAKTFIIEKKKQTSLKKWGVEHASSSPLVRAKVAKTNISRYGHYASCASPSVMRKARKTWRKKYGVTNPGSSKVIRAKVIRTTLERYGVTSTLSKENPDLYAKRIAGMVTKYGVTNPSQVKKFQKKKQKTSLKNWGYRHHMQNPDILAKSIFTSKRVYVVSTPSRNYLVQGYERFIIPSLEQWFNPNSIKTQFDEKFRSIKVGKSNYIPDFYIKNKKLFIEIKSLWTLVGRKSVWRDTVQKAKISAQNGITISWVLVFDKSVNTKTFSVLPENWYILSLAKLRKLIPTLEQHLIPFAKNKISYLKNEKNYANLYKKIRMGNFSA